MLQRDSDVINALKKNGYPPTAPKNSCGCIHFAFSDMKVLKHTDVQHYSANEKMRDLFDRNCSNPGCKNGVFGTSWPIKNIVGDRVQGYWCAYALDGISDTIYCVDCGDIKRKKEELQMSTKGRRSSGRCTNSRCTIV